jgi:aminoglycoside phosphotransferase (APT) family kinase protein
VRVWDAEVVVDEALARRLLGQFPELDVDSLRLLSEGWDRAAWLVDEQWVFGFPRRAVAVPGIERELRFLPLLAPLLPLPVSTPVFRGRPAEGFPWPFFGSAFLPGREACDVPLDDAARIEVALDAARFLRRLHSCEVAEAVGADDLPLDGNRRADMARRVPLARVALRELERLGLWRATGAIERVLDEAERLPRSDDLVVAHGDLHFRHLLVERGRASGVIDWVDLCRADPAIDLQLCWSFVPPAGRGAFLEAYGDVPPDRLLRARVVALSLCAALARYGHEEGMPTVEREALAGLERATAA